MLAVQKNGEDFAIETSGAGSFRAPMVQISAGAWAGRFSASFGEVVPLVPHGPQMGVTEPVRYAVAPVLGVMTQATEETVYLRQVKRGNIVFGGGHRGPASLDTCQAKVDPMNTLRQIPQIRQLLPALGPLSIIRTWSGVEGYVSDGLPVIGPSAKVSGLFYAFGFCGHGFQLGPGVGDMMAELIATGKTSTPIGPFLVSRFTGPRQ